MTRCSMQQAPRKTTMPRAGTSMQCTRERRPSPGSSRSVSWPGEVGGASFGDQEPVLFLEVQPRGCHGGTMTGEWAPSHSKGYAPQRRQEEGPAAPARSPLQDASATPCDSIPGAARCPLAMEHCQSPDQANGEPGERFPLNSARDRPAAERALLCAVFFVVVVGRGEFLFLFFSFFFK